MIHIKNRRDRVTTNSSIGMSISFDIKLLLLPCTGMRLMRDGLKVLYIHICTHIPSAEFVIKVISIGG